MAPKKGQNEELLDWIKPQWFQHTFVSMYMAFVSQTADPWDVPAKQAVQVMQKIWDVTNGHNYEIMTSTPVYQKVCNSYGSSTLLIISIFQTVQCCADSW
jgi:hypothetical protein